MAVNSKNKYIAFYKPYGVLSQFSGEENERTLAEFHLPEDVYAAGRLDKDSEGLLLLSNDGPFINKVTDPQFYKEKIYWAQVENKPNDQALEQLRKGVFIQGYKTRHAFVEILSDQSPFPPRNPPIRFRQNIPTCWLEIKISEGKNRQVRKMTASVGHPTLRLVRVAIGNLKLGDLKEGQWKEVSKSDVL